MTNPKPKSKKLPIYVIQKHHGRHLHYDFRIEKAGVLKSWAIPKEPPIIEGIKRLAVRVEDHPLKYANFEGGIEKGLYGAGTVKIWDKGYYILKEHTRYKLIFELKGKKLKGDYCLIKLKPNLPRDKNWLFFKKKKS